MTDDEHTVLRATVFTPTPRLTITVEPEPGGDEIHLHAGGQGVWQARMLREMGFTVSLCGHFAGEVGAVLRSLVTDSSVTASDHLSAGTNGVYIHDRRSGERHEVAQMAATAPTRHQLDDLYGRTLSAALESRICLLGGPDEPTALPEGLYRRLASDVAAAGTPVVADLSGRPLDEVIEAGVAMVKASHEDLVTDGRAEGSSLDQLCAVMSAMVDSGAGSVVITRSSDPTVALLHDGFWLVEAPNFEAVDARGAGDSFTAAFAATIGAGGDHRRALQVGAAAGALNVTRRGLASGERASIERLADQIEVIPLDDSRRQHPRPAP
ncbi:PfkB family carbohydrate kinase [Iamia sp.]|uniref:PfkB family carbohydrate kinase n=1 Tax=Iamia sp. TaxID=2722710 RepID=UPI002D14FBE6|nr:PfkB family carbohydrate kinase [Iamia sp.]HXH55759.1 PfkB family carbohydrate kinase [Iamia sp.]